MLVSPLDHIAQDEKYSKFVKFISDNTGAFYKDLWLKNARANRKLVKQCGWCCKDLQDAHVGKTAVLLGASPAIQKQVDKLRSLRMDPDFVFIGLSSGVSFLLKNDLIPHYMMIADADPAMLRFWKDEDLSKFRGTTLIANICVDPEMLSLWPGPIKFIAYNSSERKLDKKLKKWFAPINGVGHFFYSLSCQFNCAAALAYLVFRCAIQIYVGCELGFKDRETPYYAGRKDLKDDWERAAHIDIYGNIAYTTRVLFSLKLALEDFLGKLSGDGWFLNCTEAGILGVKEETRDDGKRIAEHLPWIHQLTLDAGIAQARSIMRTGKPINMGV
jgi:hypothetical protein